MSLFQENKNEKQEKFDKVLEDIKEKYGDNFITRAGKMDVDGMIKFK